VKTVEEPPAERQARRDPPPSVAQPAEVRADTLPTRAGRKTDRGKELRQKGETGDETREQSGGGAAGALGLPPEEKRRRQEEKEL
jgi:hypothetical protein